MKRRAAALLATTIVAGAAQAQTSVVAQAPDKAAATSRISIAMDRGRITAPGSAARS